VRAGGHERRLRRSVADGPWQAPSLVGEPSVLGWRWWELLAPVDHAAAVRIRARASDRAGRCPPEEANWNRLGYGNNSVQVVTVTVS
jgi:Mo-co oxidoreductase dimerisation domain